MGKIGTNKPTKAENTPAKTKTVELTKSTVEQFLMTYYTKKDLGENRNRYKEYMTDSVYQRELENEEDPVNATNKGYVVDYKYKSSKIYIDPEKLQAIVQVNYVNTLLSKKGDYVDAQKDVMNQVSLRISYVKDTDGSLKVSNIETIHFLDSASDEEEKSSSAEEVGTDSSTTESSSTEGGEVNE